MAKKWKIINGAVFCVWLALLALLFYKNYTGEPLEKPGSLADAFGEETYWYDMYNGNKKIGYASTNIKKAGNEIIIRHERQMKVRKNGKDSVFFETLQCLCTLSYSIQSFEYSSFFKNENGIKVRGETDEDAIIFFLESAEKRKVHKIPKKDFYFPITAMLVLVQQQPVPGATFTIPFLNTASLSIEDVRVVAEEIRPAKAGTTVHSLYKFKAGKTIWWAGERGIIIKEATPSGATLYNQVETIAQDPSDRILVDYTSFPFLKPEKIIPDPEKLKMLKVRITGIRLQPMLYENSMISCKNDTLTIGKETPEEIKKRSYTLPHKDIALRHYLEADEWIRSDDKNVEGNALNMATIEKNDAFRMARYLNSQLYFTVRVMPLFVLADSLDIFKSHFGDDRERTVMLASFARACGLPTRLIGGLVYRDGHFYFHTWPEVWFDKWVPVDPTFAQFPADVTHVPLKEGTLKDITSIVHDLQSIHIEILEAL